MRKAKGSGQAGLFNAIFGLKAHTNSLRRDSKRQSCRVSHLKWRTFGRDLAARRGAVLEAGVLATLTARGGLLRLTLLLDIGSGSAEADLAGEGGCGVRGMDVARLGSAVDRCPDSGLLWPGKAGRRQAHLFPRTQDCR